jgi:hypothetical protein
MKSFAAEYPDFPFLQVPLAKLQEKPFLQARLANFTASARNWNKKDVFNALFV